MAWSISQLNTLSEPVEKYTQMVNDAREERAEYARLFEEDPTQTDLMNETVYRVRTGVISPALGTNLLCWMAARAQERARTDRKYLVTADMIVAFIEKNKADFPMRRSKWNWIPPFLHSDQVTAADYCAAYLSAIPATPLQQEVVTAPPLPSPSSTGGEGAATETPDSAPVTTTRLFPQIAVETQRAGLRTMMFGLTQQIPGISPQGAELTPAYAGPTEIRFYKAADRERAMEIANALTCDGEVPAVQRVLGYEDKPLVLPGTIELWLSRNITGGCQVRQARLTS